MLIKGIQNDVVLLNNNLFRKKIKLPANKFRKQETLLGQIVRNNHKTQKCELN